MSVGKTGGVLALDLGSTVGWCYGTSATECPAWGSWSLAGIKDLGASFVGLDNELTDAIRLFQPKRVVFEAPLVTANRQTSPLIPRLHLGLAAHVESACYREEVRCFEEHLGTVRKLVLGRGGFAKPMRAEARKDGSGDAKKEVLAWCREFGWGGISSEHARDAAVVFRFDMLARRI